MPTASASAVGTLLLWTLAIPALHRWNPVVWHQPPPL